MGTEPGPGAGAAAENGRPIDFIRTIVSEDLKAGTSGGRWLVVARRQPDRT